MKNLALLTHAHSKLTIFALKSGMSHQVWWHLIMNSLCIGNYYTNILNFH